MRLLIINGPNLNMLGKREPQIYGYQTFEEKLEDWRKEFHSVEIDYFQSNYEGAIIDRIHGSISEAYHGIIVNMGAFTHYSYAIFDALKIVSIPVIEVHISHIFSREEFRKTSVLAPACKAMISGFGMEGYAMAIRFIASL